VRPCLLAGGLALLWFVQFQDVGVDGEAPIWGVALVIGLRLLADFIGAWVALSVLRLALAFGVMGLTHIRAYWPREG
jgi:hypothetical protein